MAKSKTAKRYTPEFREQLVKLHRAGRSIPELAREFGPTPWSIALWVKQADRDAGRGDGGLTTSEREELAQLRRENKRLKMEREILAKAPPGSRRRRRIRSALRIRESKPGHLPGGCYVPVAAGLHERLLRLVRSTDVASCPQGCGTERVDSCDVRAIPPHLRSPASAC